MNKKPHTILLTGFGPFPGVPHNASSLLVSQLAQIASVEYPGVKIHAQILPTDWREAPAKLHDLLDKLRPDIALHFGVARKALGFEIETCAVNATCDKPDVTQQMARNNCLNDNDVSELAATIDTKAIAARLQSLGIPVALSDDAGAYLCNAILYHSLAFARDHHRAMQAGFIHLPDSLVQASHATAATHDTPSAAIPVRDAPSPKLNWPTALTGGLAIIAACLPS